MPHIMHTGIGSSSSIRFNKKRFFIHHVPPARATDKKNSNQDRKQKELRNEIMQPESSMDRDISIQKLKEAREKVTIMKQRTQIS